MWTREEALRKYPELEFEARSKIEMKTASDIELALEIVRRFLARGHARGWYFDEELAWHQAEGAPPRTVDDLCAHFREIALVRQDGQAARALRDRYLEFYPQEEEHVPMIEALYDRGLAVSEEGAVGEATWNET